MELFPPIEPYSTTMLKVSELHTLYVEECGNPDGAPVVFLHGGPGGGCDPLYRRMFNPKKWRVVLFDQRGCGRSLPFAELRENTTWDLVTDIEAIRRSLGIEKWAVFGGSWGSTLGLAYSQTHPDRVSALMLRGIFMCRPQELRWFYQEGANHIFPEAWQHYLSPIPLSERDNLIQAFYKRLTGDDRHTRMAAARAWSIWEGSTSKLKPDTQLIDRFGGDQFAEALARIECHYFINNAFMNPVDQLLRDVHKIRHIPGVIVQGRYDVVCPPVSAYELHSAWPEADFHIIPDAGHSVTEPGIRSKLLEYTEKFSDL